MSYSTYCQSFFAVCCINHRHILLNGTFTSVFISEPDNKFFNTLVCNGIYCVPQFPGSTNNNRKVLKNCEQKPKNRESLSDSRREQNNFFDCSFPELTHLSPVSIRSIEISIKTRRSPFQFFYFISIFSSIISWLGIYAPTAYSDQTAFLSNRI